MCLEDLGMPKSKVLVTGGSGFIGSGLVRGLLAQGHHVRVFDNNSRGTLENLHDILDQIEFVEGDIRHPEAVDAAVAGMEVVFHLAFINGTQYFYQYPKLVLDVGIRGHLNISDSVAKTDSVHTFVFASSSEIYQSPNIIPTPENISGSIPDISNPRYSYAGSKLLGEILTSHYLEREGLKKIIFRPHNIYGPAMGFKHVIPQLAKKIVDATQGFTQNAGSITLQGDGLETRAFCYIEDAVAGTLLAAFQGEAGQTYNVGREDEISMADLARAMAGIYGVQLTLKTSPKAPGGTPRRCPDVAKLRALGYTPRVSLKEGLQPTLSWYKNYYLRNLKNEAL